MLPSTTAAATTTPARRRRPALGTLSANTVPHSKQKKTTTPLRSKTTPSRKNQYPQQPQRSTKKTQTVVTQAEEDEVKVASASAFPETFQFLARIRPLTPDEQIQPQVVHHHHHVAPIGRRPIIPTTTSPNHKRNSQQPTTTAVRFDDCSLWMNHHNSNSKYGKDRCQVKVDGVLGMDTSQAQVYDACGLSQHLSNLFDNTKNKNVAIVVAGDNRTGKSYTTSGGWTLNEVIQPEHSLSDTCDGLLPRCVNELFVQLQEQQKQQQDKNIGIEMSFQQLSLDTTNERGGGMQDLICHTDGSSSSWKSVASPQEVISILQQAAEQREALAELFGQRAHLICRFRVITQYSNDGGGGMLTLINLAGGRSSSNSDNDDNDELIRKNKKKEYEDGPADDRQDLQFLKRLVQYRHHQSEISKSTSCSDELNELFESMTAGKYIHTV